MLPPHFELRRKLGRLVWWRRAARRAVVACSFTGAAVWGVLAIFALDVVFHLDWIQRLVVIMVVSAGIAWSLRKWAWSGISAIANGSDAVLVAERAHGLHNDLIAALQFANPDQPLTGSPRLETKVVNTAVTVSRGIGALEAVPFRSLLRQLAVAVITVLIAGVVVLMDGPRVAVFLQRMVFIDAYYPTATSIERVAINGRVVLVRQRDRTAPEGAAVPDGAAVDFWVTASGEQPTSGQVQVDGIDTKFQRSIELRPVTLAERIDRIDRAVAALQAPPPPSDPNRANWRVTTRNLLLPDVPKAVDLFNEAVTPLPDLPSLLPHVQSARALLRDGLVKDYLFRARLDRLSGAVDYRLRLGDAVVRAARLDVIPLPIVELIAEVTPPAYTSLEPYDVSDGAVQFSVVAGSAVRLGVQPHNKPLASVSLEIHQINGPKQQFAFESESATGSWFCETASPIDTIEREVEFAFHVTDQDGYAPRVPIRGFIRILKDHPPHAALNSVHRLVVPTATPLLTYRVTDDFAIKSIQLRISVKPEDASEVVDDLIFKMPLPVRSATDLPHHGEYKLDVGALGLKPGDQLAAVLEVVDDRGRLPGQHARTEPLRLDIAEQAAVLAAIAELDQETEQRLSEIIRRQMRLRAN